MTTIREAALEAALKEAGDVIQSYRSTTGIDLGDASRMPFYADTIDKIDAALATPATDPQGYVDPYRAHGSNQVMPRVSPGRYVAHWASGGSSEVSIGMASSGDNWIAPTNWIAPAMIHELEAKGSWGELDRLEALAARPAPQPAADTRVVVKPLEWAKSHMTGWNEDYHTIPTGYTVRCADENGWKWQGHGAFGYCLSSTLAQAAAQADHETRVLSAIIGNATPAPSDKIAEAARVLLDAVTALDGVAWHSRTEQQMRLHGLNRVDLRALAGQGETL